MSLSGGVVVKKTITGNIDYQPVINGSISIGGTTFVRELVFSTHYDFPIIG